MIPRAYLIHIAGFILAGVLWMTSLYQLEIIYIWQGIGKDEFEMPFYLWTMSLPVARDLWYLVNGAAFAVGMISALTFGAKRTRRKHGEH